MVQHDVAYYLKRAGPLAEKVAACADQIDSERQMPPDLAAELADDGFFRLLLPRSLGGAELAHPDFRRILRVFGQADASVAWCLNQNNVFSTNSVRMPEETAREIWGDQRAVVTNGPPTAAVKAVPVEGGYRLSGQWNFSSGNDHATWIAALAPVGVPDQKQDASVNREGARILLMPKKDVHILDLWQVQGLRGTGSFSFKVEDLFVPAARSYEPGSPPAEEGPLYKIPTGLLFGSGFATVALEVARKSLDIAVETAARRVPRQASTLLRNIPTTHRDIGRAEATWRSADAFLRSAADAVWEDAVGNSKLDLERRIALRLASTHAIRMAAQVVDTAYSLCGAGAIFASNPIQRRFQDMHVITQHTQGSYAHYDTAGQFLLGLEPEGNF
jgi:alkylation response protein AidB-like acyl-CoA dehydrogenase